MVLMPGELRLRHVSTPSDLLGILQSMNINIDPVTLQATEVWISKFKQGPCPVCCVSAAMVTRID
jgi:hypothetical protein